MRMISRDASHGKDASSFSRPRDTQTNNRVTTRRRPATSARAARARVQLPTEHTRFTQVSAQFGKLMADVRERPAVLELLAVENLLRQLERHAAVLSKVQKALGEYLERQRAAFPRFYFVGEDDLLEVRAPSGGCHVIERHGSCATPCHAQRGARAKWWMSCH